MPCVNAEFRAEPFQNAFAGNISPCDQSK
jgi:hypothetical protein